MTTDTAQQDDEKMTGPMERGDGRKDERGTERLLIKWGTLKGWTVNTEASREALQRYHDAGDVLMSVARQQDTPEQTAALCDLIEAIDGPIDNDWSGERMTKDEAKKYVREYRT